MHLRMPRWWRKKKDIHREMYIIGRYKFWNSLMQIRRRHTCCTSDCNVPLLFLCRSVDGGHILIQAHANLVLYLFVDIGFVEKANTVASGEPSHLSSIMQCIILEVIIGRGHLQQGQCFLYSAHKCQHDVRNRKAFSFLVWPHWRCMTCWNLVGYLFSPLTVQCSSIKLIKNCKV